MTEMKTIAFVTLDKRTVIFSETTPFVMYERQFDNSKCGVVSVQGHDFFVSEDEWNRLSDLMVQK